MKSLISFFKDSYFAKDNFLQFANWKLKQLYKTSCTFLFVLTVSHALFSIPEFINSERHSFIDVIIILCRLLPLTIAIISFNIRKKINIFVHICINNFAMFLVVLTTGIIRYMVIRPQEPLGLILLDSVVLITSTMFNIPLLSIINSICCIMTVIIFERLIPDASHFAREILNHLVPYSFNLCVVIFIIDAYFYKEFAQMETIKRMALQDTLTGLYNRNILKKKVFDRLSENHLYSGSMIMIDIDNFKQINDNYSHQIGDVALCRLAGVMRENIRKDDYVIRFGGEEFLIILRDLTLEETIAVSERIRHQIEIMDSEPRFTISLGVSTFRENEPFKNSIKRTDIKLYEAKRTGKNKVCF